MRNRRQHRQCACWLAAGRLTARVHPPRQLRIRRLCSSWSCAVTCSRHWSGLLARSSRRPVTPALPSHGAVVRTRMCWRTWRQSGQCTRSSKSARAGTASPITGSPLPQRPMVLPLPVSSPHMPSSQLANDTIAFAQVGGGTATLSWLQQQQQQQQQQPSPAAMPPQQPSPATTITTIIGAPVPPSE